MRITKGYDSYHGRSGLRTFLTVVIIILTVVLILSVAAFFLLQEFVVYTDDGKAQIDLSSILGERISTQPSASPTPEQVLIVDETFAPVDPVPSASTPDVGAGTVPGVVPEVSAVPSPEVSESGQPVGETLRAVMLEEEHFTDTDVQQAHSEGYNAIILNMKGDDGKLRYTSQSQRAADLNTFSSAEGRNAAIAAITAGDGYTIARVSCFRDYRAPRQNNHLALRSSQGNWVDPGKMRWLNPSIDNARAYVVEVCAELAAMGFDEILLDNAFYPYEGRVNKILQNENYDRENLDQPITAFYEEVKAAMAAYPEVKLSIVTAPAGLAAAGENVTGQTPALLAQYADRVYVRTGSEDELQTAVNALTAAGLGAEQVVCWHTSNTAALAAGGGEAVYPA